MNFLEITEAKAKRINEAENLALDVICRALGDKIAADSPKVKIALGTYSVTGKNRQTTTHNVGLGFTMAAETLSPEQLKRYVEVSNPEIKRISQAKS